MRSKNIFWLKFLIYICLLVLSIFLMASPDYTSFIIGFVLLGLLNAHGIQLLHQASHRQAYRVKIYNDIAGTLLGVVAFIPFQKYRTIHLEHHKKLGTSEDSEFFGFEEFESDSSAKKILSEIFSLKRLRDVFSIIKFKDSKNFRDELVLSVICISLLMSSLAFGNMQIFFGWVASYILITEPIHFLIEIPEHFGCDKLSLDKNRNTRTIKHVSFIIGWYTNWNNYHSEHHRFPNIPPENLALIAKDRVPDGLFCLRTYGEFYKFYVASIIKANT